MKKITISKAQMSRLTAVRLGHGVTFTDGERDVKVYRSSVLDPQEDSPELEAELLKAANGEFKPYSPENLNTICEKVLRKRRARQ